MLPIHELRGPWKQEAGGGGWVFRGRQQALTGAVKKAEITMQEDRPYCSRLAQGCPHAWMQTMNPAYHRNSTEAVYIGGPSQPPVTST